MDLLFGLAEKYGIGIDLLLHDQGPAGLGSDGVRDSWRPFGNADLLAQAQHARLDDELELAFRAAAWYGAELMGLPAADLTVGSPGTAAQAAASSRGRNATIGSSRTSRRRAWSEPS